MAKPPRRGPRLAATTVQRLLQYHDYLQTLHDQGRRDNVASAELADFAGCESSQARRDLSLVGISGRPKLGYPIPSALFRLQAILGRNSVRGAVLFGAGRLGELLLRQNWLDTAGVVLTAAFENDPNKIGTPINGVPVLPVEEAPVRIQESGTQVAILTVGPESAQACADLAVAGGVRAIWSFASCAIDLPESVVIRYENLTAGLTDLLCAMSLQRVI